MFAEPSSESAWPRRENDAFGEARRKLSPPLRNRILVEAADSLAQNDSERAASLVSAYLRKKPQDPAALNLMADIARRLRRFDEAEQHLSRCVELSPENPGYRFNFAVILRRQEKHEAALAALNALLLLDLRNPLFLEQKATVLSLLGRHAKALACRKTLADEYPRSTDFWLSYGHALRALGSTLVEQILASHSAIEGLGERPDLDLVVGRLPSRKEGRPAHEFWISGQLEFRSGLVQVFPRVIAALGSGEVRSIGEEYLVSTGALRALGIPFFTDKGLRNFGYVGLIHLALPNARIIDMRRYPPCHSSILLQYLAARLLDKTDFGSGKSVWE